MKDRTAQGGGQDGTGVSRRSALVGIGSLGLLSMAGSGGAVTEVTPNGGDDLVFLPFRDFHRKDRSLLDGSPGDEVRRTSGRTLFFSPNPLPYPKYISVSGYLDIELGPESADGVEGLNMQLFDVGEGETLDGTTFSLDFNSDASDLHSIATIDGGSTYFESSNARHADALALRFTFQSPVFQTDLSDVTKLGLEVRHSPAKAFTYGKFLHLRFTTWIGIPQTDFDDILPA